MKAQTEAVTDYLGSGTWEIVGEYTEIERAGKDVRTELQKAFVHCEMNDARLHRAVNHAAKIAGVDPGE